jgi:hypothetical protein
MSTIQFAAQHNAEANRQREKAARYFQASLIAIGNANEARSQGDYIKGAWFDTKAEFYADKSDDTFAAALTAARGVKS